MPPPWAAIRASWLHQGPADVSQPRQALPKQDIHRADLGREPQQVWDARERVQREADLRNGEDHGVQGWG
jgi:hypothetical protein